METDAIFGTAAGRRARTSLGYCGLVAIPATTCMTAALPSAPKQDATDAHRGIPPRAHAPV